ncbi:MAG TPA: tRNA (adenosine(37)-N6)-dimethylallyltransferase MiaA [Xanthobacteraceae bacterium]|nr:tRNA (adenosine(37)-N6)-dimethylallyltransferase MiaA [Xanthobacteraceae bacterium]
MVRAVLIAGPTASGKSALALALAERFQGAVINADSMQVYRDFRVLTARPAPEEEARAPHLLYGHVDAAENYSVGRWTIDAGKALAEAENSGRLPIFAGGTGLYFKSLLKGLSDMPPVPAEVRARLRNEAREVSAPVLHARLAQNDLRMASALRPTDRQRVLRALEVFEATGRSLADWQQKPGRPLIEREDTLTVFLQVERKMLRERIDARFDGMLENGALDEVRALQARKLDPALPALKAHGAPALSRYLSGEISREQASTSGKTDTRHYAKRQETWFRHQMKDWPWMEPDEALGYLISELEK